MGTIKAVCISQKRGTEKINVEKAYLIENFGLKDDAHAGNWHRQVSLLSYEKAEEFKKSGADIHFGSFGENLLVSGIDTKMLKIGTLLKCGEALLEITQIGKECHNECEIFKRMGRCIMPTNGIFARVLKGGEINVGDEIFVCENN